MSCANCGGPTPEGAARCPSCGLPLPVGSFGAPPPGEDVWGAPLGGAPLGGASQAGWEPPPEPGPWGAPSSSYSPYPPGSSYAPYPPGSNDGSAVRLAGWWHRVGATVIDAIIIWIPARVIDAASGGLGYSLFFVLGTLVYTTLMLSSRGQTVGMMAVGTRCVREGSNTLLSTGAAVGRWAISELLNITVIGGVLDVLWPLWDAQNQTLHDKGVHSLVVKVR